MESLHLTRELLSALATGSRDPSDLVSLVMSHLFDLCPTCANEFAAFRKQASAPEVGSYESAFERVRERVQGSIEEAEREKEAARSEFEQLLAMPHRECLEFLKGETLPFRGPALAILLLQASKEHFRKDPQEALRLAGLARAVLCHADASNLVVELYAQAMAYEGNARRVSGNPRAAIEKFEHARFLMRLTGGGDRLLRAEIDHLEGSLKLDLRHLKDAQSLFQRSATTYIFEGLEEQAGSVFLQLSILYNESGRPQEALEVLDQALDLARDREHSSLYFYCQHHLIVCLCGLGEFVQAAQILANNADRYARHGDPLSLLRVAWVEGKIARGLGQLEEAEFHLLTARHGFQKEGIAYDAALVSLELAQLYLEQRRVAEVKELAEEMVQEFLRQEVSREATAALMLFQDAAMLERVTVAFIGELATYLVQVRRDPTYAFQVAS
jgi:tetratricopeptide (TPR) repeat protein